MMASSGGDETSVPIYGIWRRPNNPGNEWEFNRANLEVYLMCDTLPHIMIIVLWVKELHSLNFICTVY